MLKYCLACTNCVFIKVKNVPLTNQKIYILIAKFHKIKFDIDTYPIKSVIIIDKNIL